MHVNYVFLKKSTYGHKQPYNLEFEALNFTSISYNPGISKLSTEGQILNIFGFMSHTDFVPPTQL